MSKKKEQMKKKVLRRKRRRKTVKRTLTPEQQVAVVHHKYHLQGNRKEDELRILEREVEMEENHVCLNSTNKGLFIC